MEISEDVKEKFGKFFIALIQVNDLKVVPSENNKFAGFETKVKQTWDANTLLEQSNIKSNRDFLRRIGIDPTKLRPSGEALIRRTFSRGMSKINNIVDAGNFGSALTGISTSVYDVDVIEGEIEVRFAKPNEEYIAWGEEKTMLLKGDEVVITDEKKIMALYPYRDSKFCVIKDSTRNCLFQAHGVPGISREDVRKAAEIMLSYLNLNNKISEIQIIE